MKLRFLVTTLRDARFVSIIKLLKKTEPMLAIYLVRLVTGSGLSFAKKYLVRVEQIYKKHSRNKLQYKEL